METYDYVDFNTIRQYIFISDVNLFNTYLKEVFKDLADKVETSKKKGISKITFLDYMKLPVFIAEKLFNSLDLDGDSYLSSKEFIEGLSKLYLGDFEQTVEIIFNIFDFDKDGVINKGDIKIMLSYLPLKTDKSKVEYKFQMESLNEIDEMLNLIFKKDNKGITIDEFIKIIESKQSDVYLQLLCFLYQKKPFNEENINLLNVYRRKSLTDIPDKQFLSPQISKRIPSPNRKSIFSPADSLLKITLMNLGETEVAKKKEGRRMTFLDNNTPQVSGIKGMIRMPNEKIALKEGEGDLDTLIKTSKNVFHSPSKYLKKEAKECSLNLEQNLIKIVEFKLDDESEENSIEKFNDTYEDWIYKLSESLKLKKYWLVLTGKDIYYYKNDKKDELVGMHNLSGTFIKENGEKQIGDQKMFSFSIHFTRKTRNYYCYDKASAKNWTLNMKKAIGYLSFFDYYEMLDDIGEGKFGLVKLGVHKNTNERVAIKIMKKESMTETSDMELVRSEIDIMKLCRHQNVVKLLDHFENAEYIFIVMEYLSGGDLGEYLKKVHYKVSEKRAAHIMYQLACGLNYLHQYGILHRDLKPENIMLTECSENGFVKIMDFGLSKIMGPEERVADGFGTLSFVAPEVLIRKPYGKQIDIWSLGVILYFMLSGTLPFDDENDNEEVIAKMTVFEDVRFPSKYWSKKSNLVVDLISKCLIKDPLKRITIESFLEHPWIKEYY